MCTISVCNRPLEPTHPSVLNRKENDYWPRGDRSAFCQKGNRRSKVAQAIGRCCGISTTGLGREMSLLPVVSCRSKAPFTFTWLAVRDPPLRTCDSESDIDIEMCVMVRWLGVTWLGNVLTSMETLRWWQVCCRSSRQRSAAVHSIDFQPLDPALVPAVQPCTSNQREPYLLSRNITRPWCDWMQVIAASPLSCRGPKSKDTKSDFGHFRASEQNANVSHQLGLYEFL